MTAITTLEPKPRKPRVKKIAPAIVAQILTLVDEKPRKVLNEGRNYGIGFALAKRKGNELHLAGPISPCREYLNDQLSSEHTGKPYTCYGYKATKAGLLDDEMIYVVVGVMPYFSGGTYGELQETETKFLAEHHDKIVSFINSFEEQLKLTTRTSCVKLEDNRYAFIIPKFWAKATYLISLHSLLVRVALEGFYKEGDPMKFFEEAQTTDSYHVAVASSKLKQMIAGVIPEQNFSQRQSWHGQGIVNFEFPND